ncbi:MAG: class I SAM-dependent methyltransferase [Candidatus Zixiibacteriota bacterium]|nr:MAG: class I SAM-dependent methyltransferase [candidate division Zixibacteria bacterium]
MVVVLDALMPNLYFLARESCPGCRSPRLRTIYSCSYTQPPVRDFLKGYYSRPEGVEFEYLEGQDYVLDECLECGFVFQKYIPNEFLSRRLYEEWIESGNKTDIHARPKKLENFRQYAQEILTLILYHGKEPHQLDFFDFGMGWGAWCLMAKAFGCRAHGAELSEIQMEYARRQGITVVTWDELPQYRFDFINTEQVFEHLAQPLETLTGLARALKPHGLVKIAIPDGTDIRRRLKVNNWNAPRGSRDSLNSVHPLEHLNCYSRRAVTRMAAEAGLEPVTLPLAPQYAAMTGWQPVAGVVRNLVKPIYRRAFPRNTYYLFRPRAA